VFFPATRYCYCYRRRCRRCCCCSLLLLLPRAPRYIAITLAPIHNSTRRRLGSAQFSSPPFVASSLSSPLTRTLSLSLPVLQLHARGPLRAVHGDRLFFYLSLSPSHPLSGALLSTSSLVAAHSVRPLFEYGRRRFCCRTHVRTARMHDTYVYLRPSVCLSVSAFGRASHTVVVARLPTHRAGVVPRRRCAPHSAATVVVVSPRLRSAHARECLANADQTRRARAISAISHFTCDDFPLIGTVAGLSGSTSAGRPAIMLSSPRRGGRRERLDPRDVSSLFYISFIRSGAPSRLSSLVYASRGGGG
jgi:hypothetical protein